jgi:hypothetical protein
MRQTFCTPLLFWLTLVLAAPASASGLWGEGGFEAFSESLPEANRALIEKTLGPEWTEVVIKTGLDPLHVRTPDFQQIDAVLERAVREKYGILELFTDAELANTQAPALLLQGAVLDRIDAKYDLSSVWMLSTQPKGGAHEVLRMKYMIVGQGILVVGYPHSAPVEILDEGKALEYQYEPVINAKIVNTPGTRGLFSVRTLSSPTEGYSDFKGPMGVSIRSYQVKGSKIKVDYHLVIDQDTEANKKPIVIRSGKALSFP